MINVDRRILILGMSRASGSLANSFLIVILPIYIGSTAISLDGLVGASLLGVELREEFYIGLVLSLLGFVSSVSQPIVGRLSDQVNRRKIFIILGSSIALLATLAYPVLTKFTSVIVIRLLQGIGIGMVVPAAVALVNEYSEGTGARGEGFGYYNTLRLIGFGVGPIVSGIVYSQGPYNTPLGTVSGIDATFYVAAVGILVSILLVLVFVEDTDAKPTGETNSDGSVSELLNFDSEISTVWILAVGTFLLAGAISMFATLEEPINTRLNQGSFFFGLQFSVGILANVLFQIPVGRYSDRTGRKPLIVAGFVILFPAMVAQGVVTSSAPMFVARALLGISVAFVFPTGLALAGQIAKDKSGSVLSILTASFSLGVAFGPLLSGFLYNLGGYSTPFFVGAVGAVIALVLTVFKVTEPEDTVNPSGTNT